MPPKSSVNGGSAAERDRDLRSAKHLVSCFLLLANLLATACVAADELVEKELHAFAANRQYEATVLSIIELIEIGRLEQALSSADQHLEQFPKSRIVQLLRADILQGMVGNLSDIGSASGLPDNTLKGLKHQIKSRWRHTRVHTSTAHELLPSSLLMMGRHSHVVVADMAESRLYLYENRNGRPRLLRDYYMSVGSAGYGKEFEGDNKTPIGVYEINKYIEGKELPDLYGKGAFPVNYPNRYDRFRKRTGYGIWLHGTPSDTYARAPWSSEGCFVLSNDDLLDIGKYLSPTARTPVILSDAIDWISLQELEQRKSELLKVLTRWKRDWEQLDMNSLIAHYAKQDFNFDQGDYQQWLDRKLQVNDAKSFVQLDIELESLFAYPGEKNMFVVRYRQKYLSNNFAAESSKEQYWKMTGDGRWQILYEG